MTPVTENGAPPSPGGFGELVETSRRVINGTLVIDYRHASVTEEVPPAPPPPVEQHAFQPQPTAQAQQQQQVQSQQLQQQQLQSQRQASEPEQPKRPMTDAQLRRWIEAYEPDRLW